ncbi:hypothetical protein NGR_c05760 [Sinorhizobium fredii NGR234]|uniref:Uncharacterized protein n=1 Tax=Sinorhizobium fredii (strain NBRC 101917 / NGR234) TaxID=394 RepID=C3MHP1_SINFN|nr:hypothetical protein NGR_c05760 [Sinorhizobium fredii NGR234]
MKPDLTDEQWRRMKEEFGDVAVENPGMLADLLDMLTSKKSERTRTRNEKPALSARYLASLNC